MPYKSKFKQRRAQEKWKRENPSAVKVAHLRYERSRLGKETRSRWWYGDEDEDVEPSPKAVSIKQRYAAKKYLLNKVLGKKE